jgi:hypothetical protein
MKKYLYWRARNPDTAGITLFVSIGFLWLSVHVKLWRLDCGFCIGR